MEIMDYFKPVSTWSVDEVREFLVEKSPEEYTLLDVRQPHEYEQGHLPGAKLVPVGELASRLGELDPEKPTIIYCALGGRSRAAASILSRSGFREVYSMDGGIFAWKGRAAVGTPEAAVFYFSPARAPEDYLALAWLLEEGTHRFYERVAHSSKEPEVVRIFRDLSAAEEQHKSALSKLFEGMGSADPASLPSLAAAKLEGEPLMEGGIPLAVVWEWLEGKPLRDLLEMALTLETNAYDRYLVLRGAATDEAPRKVFDALCQEERHHLERLAALFERYV